MTNKLICILDEDKEKCTENSSCDSCKFSYVKPLKKKQQFKDDDFYLDDDSYFAM